MAGEGDETLLWDRKLVVEGRKVAEAMKAAIKAMT